MARLVHTDAFGILSDNPNSEGARLVPAKPKPSQQQSASTTTASSSVKTIQPPNGQSGPVLHHSSLSPSIKATKQPKLSKKKLLSSTTDQSNRPQMRSPRGPLRSNPMNKLKKKPFSSSKRTPYRPARGDDAPYEYNRYHSRGAIALNGFDSKANSLRYDWRKGDLLLPKWELLFRKSMYIVQIMVVITAGIMIGGTIMAERNGWDFTPLIFGQMEEALIYTPFVGGAFAALTAFVGCVGAKTRDRCGRVMLLVYIVMLFISLILAVASAAQAMADKSNVWQYASRQWDAMTYVEEQIFEWDHFCCNFDKLDPCCRFTYGEGECVNEYICFERVQPHLIDCFNIIITCSVVHAVWLFIVFLATTTLYALLAIRDKYQEGQETKERVEDSVTKSVTTASAAKTTDVKAKTKAKVATNTGMTDAKTTASGRKVRTTKRAKSIRSIR